MRRIYLDYAAATPVDPRVKAAMEPYFSEEFGNAASVHIFGQRASAAIFKARYAVAKAIGAKYDRLIFTASATEANNLALRGVVKAFRRAHPNVKPRIITSSFEHTSVYETCEDLAREGVEVIYAPVSQSGFVDLKKLKAALNERTILVSIMYVNNEVGTIQPISAIAKMVQAFKKQKIFPLFHTDAVQAFQYLDCNVERLGVDLMTLSSHKIYGPKGVGALYARQPEVVAPIITGGGQEPHSLYSGTPNTPAIVGFGKAVEILDKMRVRESKRLSALRDYCWRQIKAKIKKAKLNGSLKWRVANNLNIYFPGRSSHELMVELDLAGVAVSSGMACSARLVQPSRVLTAMGFPKKRCFGSLRITFGRQTTKSDIDWFVKKLVSTLD